MRQGGSGSQSSLLVLVAAAVLAVACGRTSDAPAGAGQADGWDPVQQLDGEVTGLSLVSDRDGGALVAWESADGQVSFARWDDANQVWSFPRPVALKSATLVDTYRSGHPILVGKAATTDLGEASFKVALRFDPARNEWGPPQSLSAWLDPIIGMDGVGNACVYESLDGTRADREWPWSWWPVEAEALKPPKHLMEDVDFYVVPSPLEGAWLLQDGKRTLRAFDASTGDWGSPSLSVQPPADLFYVVVGSSGQSLAVSARNEMTRLVVEIQRYDAELATWQPKETASITEIADENGAYGAQVLSSSFGDTVVALANDVLELSRRPATTGVWSTLQVLHDVQPQADFLEDESGDLYGYLYPSNFFHCDAEGSASLTSLPDDGPFPFQWVTTARGAFALGSGSGQLVAHRHDGTEWRPARGLPPAIHAQAESRSYGLARLGQDRALVVWTGRDRRGPLYAAFLE